MKLIIKIKKTATLSRIEQLSNTLEDIRYDSIKSLPIPFSDVIESVSMEK